MTAPSSDLRGRGPLFPRSVLLLSAAVVLSTLLPHLYQAATVAPDEHFSGVVETVDDQNLYLSWCEQIRRGDLLVENLYTAERGPAFLVAPPWLVIGLLARVIPLPLLVVYHGARIVWGFAHLLIVWLLIREFFRRDTPRMYAFVAVALGSGLKALGDAINAISGRPLVVSADLMPELWTYHSLSLPNFAFALLLMALLAVILLRAYRRPSPWLTLAAAVTIALLTVTHPYDIAVIAPLLVAHAVVCRVWRLEGGRNVAINLWTLVGVIPPAVFLWWQTQSNPLMAAWNAQNRLLSPHPVAYLVGFGVILPLAVVGRVTAHRRRGDDAADWLFVLWLLIAALAAYGRVVIPFERRCVEGMHIPLAIFAGVGIADWLVPALRRWLPGLSARRAGALAMALLLVGVLPTSVKLLADSAVGKEPVIPRDWVRGFEWIERNTPRDARVMTDHPTGSFLARYALRHVHYGHWNLTVDVDRKERQAQRFYDPRTPAERRLEILREAGCDWVAVEGGQAGYLTATDGLDVAFASEEFAVLRFAGSPTPPQVWY